MNNRESAKLNAYHAVVRQFSQPADAAALEMIPALKTAMHQFTTLVAHLDDTAPVQEAGSSAESITKENARTNLINLTLTTANQLFAWASQAGEPAVKAQANLSLGKLLRLKDAVLPARVEAILQLATTYREVLLPYGFTDSQLQAFATASTRFNETVAAPRNKIARRSAGSKNMDSDFAAAGKLVKEQFNKLMPGLQTTFPDVYHAYLTNSKVMKVSAAGSKTATAKRNQAAEKAPTGGARPET